MKLFFLSFICLIILSAKSIAQVKKQITTAQYEFKPADVSGTPIGSVIFSNLTYTIKSDGSVTSVSASDLPKLNDYINIEVNGPESALYSVSDNLVKFSGIDSLQQYNPIKFIKLNLNEVILGYNCYAVANNTGDTLYLSHDLPSYINPFFLNSESINDGVVKAILHVTGTFYLKTVKKTDTPNQLYFKAGDNVIKAINIFFKN